MIPNVETRDYLPKNLPPHLQGFRAAYPTDFPFEELQTYTLDTLRKRLLSNNLFGSDSAPYGLLTFESYSDRAAPWTVQLSMSDHTMLPGKLVIPGHIGLVLESAFDNRNRRQLCMPFHYTLFDKLEPSKLSGKERVEYLSRVRLFLDNAQPANNDESNEKNVQT